MGTMFTYCSVLGIVKHGMEVSFISLFLSR